MIYNHPLFVLLYKNYDGKVFYLVTSEEVKYNRKKYMVGGKMKENKYDDEIFFENTVRWIDQKRDWQEQENGMN